MACPGSRPPSRLEQVRPVAGASESWHRAYIGLGANLGQPRRALERALDDLRRVPQSRVLAASAIYRSPPEGAPGPDYANAVALLETTLDPWALLQALQTLEGAHGRTRPYRHAPRTLDLDLLLYDSLEVADPSLQLPHPRMHLRAFVLRPLLELSPQAVIPGHGPARSWLDRLDTPPLRRWQGQDDGRPQDP